MSTGNETDNDAKQVAPVVDQSQETESKISEENARLEMAGFMKSYDIDENDLVVDQGPEAIQTILNRLVRAVMTGQLEILGNGCARLNLVVPAGGTKSVDFARLDGTAQREHAKEKNAFSAHMAQMGSLCNIPPLKLAKLDSRDLSIIQRLSSLFTVV